MPRPVFEWYPDTGSQCSTKPNVSSTKFGDGYELRVATTINTCPEKWSVKFTRAPEESQAIDAFLRARKGQEAFTWTTPDGVEGTFVCREWRKNRLKGGSMEISCDFEQVFEY